MQEKADSELVRRQNRRVVLSALRRQGPLARIELGRATGLSPASITSIASQLIDENIIEELNEGPVVNAAVTRRGRPIVRLGLKPAAAYVVAVNISIDSVALAIADFSGAVVARNTLHVPTYDANPRSFGGEVAELIAGFVQASRISLKDIARIGVAVQGLADAHAGTIIWTPAFKARNIPLAEPISRRFGVPCTVANDANMIAEGFLSSTDRDGVTATIFTGYGVGMGLIINGKVYYGTTGGASEFGHMNHVPHGALCRCGRSGCIEAYASDYGIIRTATGNSSSDAPHTSVPTAVMSALLDRAVAGDKAARGAFEKAGEALGFGIARLIAILNPDRIILAGPGLRAQQILEPALHRALEDGVVEELRSKVKIEFVPFDTDMILRGTIDALLREVDGDVTAVTSSSRNDHRHEHMMEQNA